MERNYRIFGKNIKLNTFDNKGGNLLHEELSVYPVLDTSDYDIQINYVSNIDVKEIISSNPSSHSLAEDSMICQLGSSVVKFYFKGMELNQIDFSLKSSSGFDRAHRKWKSMQYASIYEAIGQVFHELILVPMAFLINEYSVVHSSGIINREGKVVLFGGTGGVGKTSLEMTLCLDHGASFFNDDIAIVDTNGNCFPNFSYPKIYGYNLQGAPELRKRILGNLSLFNKIHYIYRAQKGLNKVRRRVNPVTFYGNTSNKSEKISAFVILFRSNVDSIMFERISAKKAADLNSLIMSSEYNVFLNHLRWHEFNAASQRREIFTNYKSVIEANTLCFEKGLSRIENIYIAHIPKTIGNNIYKREMVSRLKEYQVL